MRTFQDGGHDYWRNELILLCVAGCKGDPGVRGNYITRLRELLLSDESEHNLIHSPRLGRDGLVARERSRILADMIAAAPSSTAGKTRATISGWSRPWPAIVLAVLLLLLVGARFAQPIEDGDTFWHMVYGSQMVDRGSLRVDHSQFSWMPASNEIIYCAWTGELLFLAVWKCFGIAGLFALRYAAVLAILALMAIYAYRQRLLARPEIWLVLLVTMLASVVATMPKPEMLSLVLWNALVFCWFELLERSGGQGGRRSGNLLPWIYAMPCIVLVWVNTHGAFILAAPFILIATVGVFSSAPPGGLGI